jgi:hypothetical protein
MTDVLYRWPEAARFGKTIPKTKFYERAVVTPAVRTRFVAEVEGITWAYKLAESTINLPSSSEVPEIQVLVIKAKGTNVDDSVLSTIDKAIKQPVIFEIATQGRRMTATLKQDPRAGGTTHRVEPERRPATPAHRASRSPVCMPRCSNRCCPPRLRPGEGLSDLADRLAAGLAPRARDRRAGTQAEDGAPAQPQGRVAPHPQDTAGPSLT